MTLHEVKQVVETVITLYEFFKDFEKVKEWIFAKNLNFGGVSPCELIQLGRGHKVLEFINNAKYERGEKEEKDDRL